MKKVFFILTFIFTVADINQCLAKSFDRCPFNPTPKVIFRTSLGELEYDFSKSKKDVSAIAEKPALGLAQRRLGAFLSMQNVGIRYGKGYCVMPEEIEIYIGIAKPIIYVSSEFKPGECFYNFIVRHEQAHIQTTIRMLDHFVRVAPGTFSQATRKIRPIYIKDQGDLETANQQLYDEYSSIITQMKDKLEIETEKEQVKIDAPELDNLIIETCAKHYKDINTEIIRLTLEN
ncbi:MAG: hypothetical protein LBR70_02675 [Lactobacillaceae bacterium]|jgi:hypothetical protein|nr:hypothetical protein [Lactobacillaceae bacterium]